MIPDDPKPDHPSEKDAKKKKLTVVDRRRVGRDDETIEAHEPNLKPTFVEELEGRVHLAEARLKQRLAELDDEARKSRERVALDLERRTQEKEKVLLLDVLEILDDLDRASSFVSEAPAVKAGLDLVSARLETFLSKHGCEKKAPLGEPFDPNAMEAVNLIPGPKDEVVSVYTPAILRGEELLRPARVAVGSGQHLEG
jgi:molecular chaperone GrpE